MPEDAIANVRNTDDFNGSSEALGGSFTELVLSILLIWSLVL